MKQSEVIAIELAQPQYNMQNTWTAEVYSWAGQLLWAKHCSEFAVFDMLDQVYRCRTCSDKLTMDQFVNLIGTTNGHA